MEAENGKKRGGQILLIVLFLLVLFVPAALGAFTVITGKEVDVELKGYTAQNKAPSLSVSSWLDGTFQQELNAWFPEKIRPRGLMVKTYNTANLLLFHKKDGMVVGKDYDLFEMKYVTAELGLLPEDDFSDPANVERLEAFVAKLETLQQKLKAVNKTLIYYVGPSKASAHRDSIPAKYDAVSTHPARAVDVMRSLLEKSSIPYLICSDLEANLPGPSFYTTGIHWSRIYEQTATRELVRLMAESSGRPYRNVYLGEMLESTTPYDRDTDLLDLVNVFYRPSLTYYEYEAEMEEPEDDWEPLRILIQGDSFALGLRNDLIAVDPIAEVYYITRNESVVDRENEFLVLWYDWSKMDWNRYLPNVDVIAIEAAEPLIGETSFGFVDALIAALDEGGDW